MSLKHGDGDIHYKMCKKIAQLTKVIYQLNTQNEDKESWGDQLRRRHEEEVRTVCSDAERRMEEVKKVFCEAEEKRSAAFEAAQRRYKTELSEMKEKYVQKVSSMVNELSASKKMFEEVIAEVKEKCQSKAAEEVAKLCAAKEAEAAKLCAAKDVEMANLRAAKEAEVTNLVREYNDRYKSMLAEQMDARDSLEKQVRLLRSQLDDFAVTHANEGQQWAKKLAEAEDATARAVAELARLRESSGLLETEGKRLQQECDDLRSRLDAEIDSHGTLLGTEATLRQEMEELKSYLKATKDERDSLEKALNEKTATLAKALSDVTDLENQKSLLETRQSRYAHDVSTSEKNNQRLVAQVQTLERRVTELQEAFTLAEEKTEQHRKRERSLGEHCEALQQQIDELVKKHQEELAGLRSSHEVVLATIKSESQKSSGALVNQLQREREELENRHAEELRNLQEQHNQRLAQLSNEHEKAINDLRHQLENVGGVKLSLRATIVEIQQRVEQLETELNIARSALQEADARHSDLMAKHKAMIEKFTTQMAENEASADARISSERDANAEKIRGLEAELDTLRVQFAKEREMSEEAWENKYTSQIATHEQVLQELRLEHSEQVRRFTALQKMNFLEMQTEHEKVINNLKESARCELEEERDNFNRAKKELNNQLRKCEEKLKQAQSQIDSMRNDAKEQAGRLLEEVRALKEHIASITANSENLQGELKTTRAALQRSEDQCKNLTKAVQVAEARKQELQRAYEQLEQSTNQSRMEVEALHKDHIASMDKKHAQKLQIALDELRTALTVERNAVQQRADEALAAMRQKYTDSQEELRKLKLNVDALMHDLRRSSEEIQKGQLNMAALKEEFATTVEAMKHDFEKEKNRLHRFREDCLNEVAKKHRAIVDDLMCQHNEKQEKHDALLRELQTAFDELRHRYEYRESRAEDVAMINRLMMEGRQKDQALKKATNDLKMYRLELINREENYNKVFGRQPRIASSLPADKELLTKQGVHRRGYIDEGSTVQQ